MLYVYIYMNTHAPHIVSSGYEWCICVVLLRVVVAAEGAAGEMCWEWSQTGDK